MNCCRTARVDIGQGENRDTRTVREIMMKDNTTEAVLLYNHRAGVTAAYSPVLNYLGGKMGWRHRISGIKTYRIAVSLEHLFFHEEGLPLFMMMSH